LIRNFWKGRARTVSGGQDAFPLGYPSFERRKILILVAAAEATNMTSVTKGRDTDPSLPQNLPVLETGKRTREQIHRVSVHPRFPEVIVLA
jgi:hypothetical protein